MLASVAAMDQPCWPIERMILASAGGFAPVNEARKLLNSYDGTRDHMRRILETTLIHSPLRSDEAYLDRRHRLSLVPGSWECTAAARFRRPGVKTGEKEEIDYRAILRPTLIVAGAKDPLREAGLRRKTAEGDRRVRAGGLSRGGPFPAYRCTGAVQRHRHRFPVALAPIMDHTGHHQRRHVKYARRVERRRSPQPLAAQRRDRCETSCWRQAP